ncbi:MOSC domain-containing protein [Planktothrix agardhii]|uniref:MOSC domain-containing protein n=1 Tax=Planktothrix agardhii TaxID=1160 RepID=UPI002876690F|nr:MOSC domain-containing protein [Planktothrix agardhii]MDS1345560.1 MOSC domain-containing protein [Planktothrix agardhii NRERC-751]
MNLDDVAIWLQNALKQDNQPNLRLVRQSPNFIRSVDPNYAVNINNQVSFADGYPCLLTNTASLVELNRKLTEIYPISSQEVPMNRFRPNLVIDTDQPFIEDQWKVILIGEVYFDLVKPCSPCIALRITVRTFLNSETISQLTVPVFPPPQAPRARGVRGAVPVFRCSLAL